MSCYNFNTKMLDQHRMRNIIDESFKTIGGVKAFTSYQNLSPAQLDCIDYLKQHHDDIYSNKSRDLHLKELVTCITGNDADDEDEPIGPGAFSQYRFYEIYIHDLVYHPEKFDFLLRCVENSVCVVQITSLFLSLVERIATKGKVVPLPDYVINYDQLLEEDEEKRIETFTLKKDWVCQVPHFLGNLPTLEDKTSVATQE